MIGLSSQYKVEEPFVQQNDHFDDKGGDEEEMNGSGFQPDKRQKEDISSSFVCCRMGKVDQGRRKGVERQKGKGSNC